MASTDTQESVIARHGVALAAVAAVLASIPGLRMPFISDDWANLAGTLERFPLRTAFGYFRPLYLASYRAELKLWGLSPVPFHLTNLVLIAACAALVVLTVRTITGDRVWAAAAGLLFALHPYHVENAAWVAGRSDVAATALALLSILAYERWTRGERGFAFGALAAFEAALLFKESVVLLPALVLVLRLVRFPSGLSRAEWKRGILPLGATAAVHFLVLRRFALHGSGLNPLRSLGLHWIKRAIDFVSAAVVPAHAERIEAHPWLFAAWACAIVASLAFAARRHVAGRVYEAAAVALVFGLAMGPSLLSFQERYLFFPSVVSAAGLSYLLLRSPKRIAGAASLLLLAGWLGSLGMHWHGWLEAGRASERLVVDLTEASRRGGVKEIAIANQPYRVAGAPLAGDLDAAVRLSGGASVRVFSATALNLPNVSASGIDGPWSQAIQSESEGVRLRVRMAPAPFSGIFLPLDRTPGTMRVEYPATLSFDEEGGVTVTIPKKDDGTRAAYAWYDGSLRPLF